MNSDRSSALASFISAAALSTSVRPSLREEFVLEFPEATTNELYAGYELAHELTTADAIDRIDDVFDVIIADSESARIAEVEIDLLGVPARYFLSARSCGSILDRARRRGKKIPELLRRAMEAQARV